MSYGFESRRPERPQSIAPTVNAPAQVPFFYMAHPNRYDLFDGELLPVLSKLRLQPGVEGVDHRGDHMLAKTAKERRGWQLIEWGAVECEAFGQSYPEYLHYFDGKAGRIYVEVWTKPVQMRGGTPSWQTDSEGYKQFLRAIVAAGLVPEPDPSLTESLEARLQASIDRMTPRATNSPSIQRQVNRCEEQLLKLQALKNGTPQIAAPEPTKKAPAKRRGRAKSNG